MTIRMFQGRYTHGMSMSAEVDHHYIPTMIRMLLVWISRYDMASNNCRRSSLGATSSASMNEPIMNRVSASSSAARLVCLCSEVGATASFVNCISRFDFLVDLVSSRHSSHRRTVWCCIGRWEEKHNSTSMRRICVFIRLDVLRAYRKHLQYPSCLCLRTLNIYPL
ncbi:hypothetical protein AUEXF2481DRAFT_365120 [Aureobasidium subglaciale EXF-2481]|uniref:Uncharacterized protein n=1 Tax=Aureobasidium subglaciale (strain EXF-2481) TaxID=1043005 RepID=A0A074YFM5_AURSE|nr:uncharacterized protein AUEXF2481DRAFT_365120 [Aureobasidium subglaciale EXF-2481]KEQ92902.1 hypothetical protein AUEXF2481DRAFT_365120 [Aureobasidium subglaciale EXF-2481]